MIAVDAPHPRARGDRLGAGAHGHPALSAALREYECRTHEGGRYAVRPIRPEDEPALRRFADEVDNRDLWHQFFVPLRARTHETAARLSRSTTTAR